MFDKFLTSFGELDSKATRSILQSKEKFTRSDVYAKLKEFEADIALNCQQQLSEDTATWLEVLLCTGKAFVDQVDKVVFNPAEFVRRAELRRKEKQNNDGLIYLFIWDENVQTRQGENVLFWIIDAGGELAKINGEAGVGAVYFAETGIDDTGVSNALWRTIGFTADFWKKIKAVSRGRPGVVEYQDLDINTQPKRVADCVTDFFAAWMTNGGFPGGRQGNPGRPWWLPSEETP